MNSQTPEFAFDLPSGYETGRPGDGIFHRFQDRVEDLGDRADVQDVHVMGGADVIRRALDAGLVDELTIIIAPVVRGGRKGLLEGFSKALDLENLGVRQSEYATFINYGVKRP